MPQVDHEFLAGFAAAARRIQSRKRLMASSLSIWSHRMAPPAEASLRNLTRTAWGRGFASGHLVALGVL